MRSYRSNGIHWRDATNPRLRRLALEDAYRVYPEMMDAEEEHDGTIEVCFGSQGATLTLGLIDEEALSLFSHGQCAILAWAVHTKTGLPLAVFTSAINAEQEWSGHVAVNLGKGRFLDITGVINADDVDRRFRILDGQHEVLGEQQFKELIVDADYFDDPTGYLCELEQLVLDDFADLLIAQNKETVLEAQAAMKRS